MYQQITVVGNVGREPEMRYTQGGVAVCDFSVAVNKKYETAAGEKRDETTWFRVTCWRQLAETMGKYLTKGKQVMVVGEVSASAYTAKDGHPAASLEITANVVKFLGQRTDGDDSGEGESTNTKAQRGGNRRGAGEPPVSPDDIPF